MTYQQPYQPTPPTSPTPQPAKRPRQWIPFAVVSAVVAFIIIGSLIGSSSDSPGAPEPSMTQMEAARDYCTAGDLSDGGHTLVLDMGGGDYGSGALSIDQVSCVLSFLGAPTSVTSRMDSTRALDGMQEAEWDGMSASWTYHPDDGLDVIITEN